MSETTIEVNRDLRSERLAAAEAFRTKMTSQGTYVVRLLSSPGAGKTTLLQKTAERLAPYAPTRQITTGGACHLELPLEERALPDLGAQPFDFLFIEDVGNLICPASHSLGEHLRVIVLSTTEGDDKPGKYPKAFRTSDVAILSKLDLLPHVPFSVERATQDALSVQPDLTILSVCALTGEGLDAWCQFLVDRRQTAIKKP